jgi:N-acetylglucosamine kinase-like BadF-type ATPase
MAGSRGFWQEFAAKLTGFGQVVTGDDSLPILELATHGHPGLALHAGTGSFVAARAPDGSVHFAGGLGWRFGDPGSGYDLGQRAIAQGLLELQGWAPPSQLGPAVRAYAELGDAANASVLASHFYSHAHSSRHIAAFAPTVLRLAGERDEPARRIVLESTGALLDLAISVAAKLFSAAQLKTMDAGLSGPILNHPLVVEAFAARSPFILAPITETPIEGVRQLLTRGNR